MKLATNHQGKGDRESRPDRYYRKIYQKLENGKTLSWNWAACGLVPWLIFRKMYFAAAIIHGLVICLTPFFDSVYLIFMIVPIMIMSGLLGNWFYIRHVHQKIDQGYHLANLKNMDPLSASLFMLAHMLGRFGDLISAIFILIMIVSMLVTIYIEKKKVRALNFALNV